MAAWSMVRGAQACAMSDLLGHDALAWLVLVQKDVVGSHSVPKHSQAVHFVNVKL